MGVCSLEGEEFEGRRTEDVSLLQGEDDQDLT